MFTSESVYDLPGISVQRGIALEAGEVPVVVVNKEAPQRVQLGRARRTSDRPLYAVERFRGSAFWSVSELARASCSLMY